MNYISRIYDDLQKHVLPGKVLVLYGSRQVGKTTLLQNYLKRTELKHRFETGENIRIQNLFSVPDQQALGEFVTGYNLLVLDEAQLIANIGRSLKLLVDTQPNLGIIATGSSSFELAGQVGEPLTGRKQTLTLYPVSILELSQTHNPSEIRENLPNYLIYGTYPEVLTLSSKTQKQNFLIELTEFHLLKDILTLEKVKSSKILLDLLRLLAFQIGSEVSLSELGQKLGIDYKTVARYLDLLGKSYIIYELSGFSRNLRSEITKKSKYYFYDTGLRNALISNFNDLELRNDQGQLWENFLMMERLKKRSYSNLLANPYFWRTWRQKELGLVEEREGKLFGYEFKFAKSKAKVPSEWLNTYPEASFELINQKNWLEFVS